MLFFSVNLFYACCFGYVGCSLIIGLIIIIARQTFGSRIFLQLATPAKFSLINIMLKIQAF